MARRPSSNPLVAVAYLRVSTEDQRLGPEAQRAAIEVWAQREGVRVAAWHVDAGVSGGADIADRAGLVAALAGLRTHGAGVLAIAKRDRLARDVYVAATIERAVAASAARVVSAEGTANGDTAADAFLRTILDGAAAYERALIRSRTKAALAAKKARGERVGTVSYGYRLAADRVAVETDEAEQGVIGCVRELRAAGLSERGIVATLAGRGVLSRTGKPLAKTQVHNILSAVA
jgi:DNA invertase Pin-like site-specific DNA recombinase